MLLLNFSHPLTAAQREQVEQLLDKTFTQIFDVKVQFDMNRACGEQVVALVDSIGLTSQQWQNEPIVITPPAYSFVAVALLAELHGRIGYFPPCLRLRQISNSMPPQFEVAEILDLVAIREQARQRR